MKVDILHISMAGACVGVLFKDRIMAAVKKGKEKFFSSSKLKMEAQVYKKLSELFSEQHNLWDRSSAELNHIKGQLQEVLQTQKQHGEAIGHNLNTIAVVSTQTLNEVRGLKEAADKVKPPVIEPSQIYLEALAKLAQGSAKTLERQEQIEKLLVQLGNEIKKLTHGV